jgi:chromosomal replication initiation ATPase DnaA
MASHGYNPLFVAEAQRKRSLAAMRRAMKDAEQEARRLEKAARDAADAILEAAYEEARIIMARAYDEQPKPRRPVAEIIGEVAAEYRIPPRTIREGGGTKAVRDARRTALRRTVRERQDLSGNDIARIFGAISAETANRAIREARHG